MKFYKKPYAVTRFKQENSNKETFKSVEIAEEFTVINSSCYDNTIPIFIESHCRRNENWPFRAITKSINFDTFRLFQHVFHWFMEPLHPPLMAKKLLKSLWTKSIAAEPKNHSNHRSVCEQLCKWALSMADEEYITIVRQESPVESYLFINIFVISVIAGCCVLHDVLYD